MTKISKTHHKTRDGVVKKNPVRAQVGDGKLPNKYWVQTTNDFYICENGMCDWASDTVPKKVMRIDWKTHGPFDTFAKAQDFVEDEVYMDEVPPTQDRVNWVLIEDRISGVIWEEGIHAYRAKGESVLGGESWEFRLETNDDTYFTRETMEKRGVPFR